MKELKSIGLFFALGSLVFCIGFLGGIRFGIRHHTAREHIFGQPEGISEEALLKEETQPQIVLQEEGKNPNQERASGLQESKPAQASETEEVPAGIADERVPFAGFLDAASLSGVLGFDTEYVIEEMDVLRGTVVETTLRLPEKYVGMDLDTFVQAMNTYAAAPPLSELERGFVGLEVLSFSRQRVVVQMNYRYVQPGESFYLALIDHQIVVLLEDQRTIFINTGISANMISESMREELMQGMIFVEDESSLYDFLESYSS